MMKLYCTKHSNINYSTHGLLHDKAFSQRSIILTSEIHLLCGLQSVPVTETVATAWSWPCVLVAVHLYTPESADVTFRKARVWFKYTCNNEMFLCISLFERTSSIAVFASWVMISTLVALLLFFRKKCFTLNFWMWCFF